ncbi:MAG: patatin-like phospholipase family protein [Pseudomonadota bacterium]
MGRDYQWDPSRSRDRHLMPGGPKRILALDGGGIRGLLTCGILRHIEDTLRERIAPGPERDAFVLADYYDFIGGTSTGSIVAAWLALGKPVKELQDLYMTMGSEIFSNPRVLPQIFVSRFDARKLDEQLGVHLEDRTLDSTDLKTGLGVTAKRMDSGSAWILTNNPRARFWERSEENNRPNKDYVLRNVVRASAAAPAYFDHVDVQIEEGAEPGAFMDGAVAGLNNPSVAFWLYTTIPGYGLNWNVGAENLLITSVGTGQFRQRFSSRKLGRMVAVQQAVFSLAGSIQDVGNNQLMIMQALSKPRHPYPMNADVDSLANPWDLERGFAAPYCITPEPLFEFQRYDASLDSEGLERLGIYEEGEPLGPGKISKLQKMDCAENKNLHRLKRIGERAGDLYVKPEHFPRRFDTPGMVY